MKYAVKFRGYFENGRNPWVMTFNTADATAAGALVVAERLTAMVSVLVQGDNMSTGTLEEISVAPNAGGAGTLLFPKGAEVDAFITTYNGTGGFQAPLFGSTLANAPIVGILMQSATAMSNAMLPKGTSTLLTESAAAGPKGRVYIPSPSIGSNTLSGQPSDAHLSGVKRTFEVFYGFFAGTPTLPKIFGVKSAAGFNLTLGVKPSPNYSHLKSRTR